MWGGPGGLGVLVADVAVGQPPVEQAAVAVVGQRPRPAGAAPVPGEQTRVGAGPAGGDPVLLGADLGLELVVDGDCGLAAHLVVEVAQVRGALAVVDQTVEGQGAGVGGPQPAPDQDQGDQPGVRVSPAIQVGRGFDLRHDVLGEPTRPPRWPSRGVSGEEHRGGRQGVIPAVLADRGEEQVQAGDGVLLGAEPGGRGGQPGQVAFQQRPVDPGQRFHGGRGLAEERAESGERADVAQHGAHADPAAEPQPGPALGQLAQPGLGKAVEAQVVTGFGGLAGVAGQPGQGVQPPDIAGVLDLPSGALVQRRHDVVGVQHEPLIPAAGLRRGQRPPLLAGAIEQRAHGGGLDLSDRPVHHWWRCGDRLLVVAALERVLQLQPQLRGQSAEVDAGLAAQQAMRDVVGHRRAA